MARKSELVTWSPTFSVGVKLVDDQHKGMLDVINDMFNHVTGNEEEEREYFKSIIDKVVTYVKVHFKTEEQIMLHINYPGYAEHKHAHDTFVLAVVDSIKNFESGKRWVLVDFTKYLKEWALTHIAIMDKQYFDYFKHIATRKADGKLSINQADVLRRNQGK